MSRRIAPRWAAFIGVAVLAASCTSQSAATPQAPAAAIAPSSSPQSSVSAARIGDPVTRTATAGIASAPAVSSPTISVLAESRATPPLPQAKITKVLDKAAAVVQRANIAAQNLDGMRITAATKPRTQTRATARQVTKMATVLRTLRDDAAPLDKVTDAITTLQAAMKDSRAATTLARKAAKKINQRLSQCPETARACVDLTTSMSWLQSGGEVTYGPVKIASGRDGLRTRPGTWTVYWKHKDHVSGYYGTPMPNSIFFDRVGIAFHQGSLKELSHGCVHLSWAASQAYWDALTTGDQVYVFGQAPYQSGQVNL